MSDLADKLRELADALDAEAAECRAKSPQSGRWIGRAVAYGASATRIRQVILDAESASSCTSPTAPDQEATR